LEHVIEQGIRNPSFVHLKVILDTIEWHTFHPRFINEKSVVVDLGTHLGRFSSEMISRYRCRYYAIEAVPDLCARIKKDDLLTTVNVAVWSKSEPVGFVIRANPEASSIEKMQLPLFHRTLI
jgi:hypothetical protein